MEYLISYLVLGILFISILEITTRRVSHGIRKGSYETQEKFAAQGSPVGSKTAMVATGLALLIFWPVALAGVVQKWYGGRKHDK